MLRNFGLGRSQWGETSWGKQQVFTLVLYEKWELGCENGGRGSLKQGSLEDRVGTGCGEVTCKEVSFGKGQHNMLSERQWSQMTEGYVRNHETCVPSPALPQRESGPRQVTCITKPKVLNLQNEGNITYEGKVRIK